LSVAKFNVLVRLIPATANNVIYSSTIGLIALFQTLILGNVV